MLAFTLLFSGLLAQQLQPDSYKTFSSVKRPNYERVERERLNLNADIPPIEGLRIATYNVHFFKDLYNIQDSVGSLLLDIDKMNATALLFQEIPSENSPEKKNFELGLEGLGYIYQAFGAATGSTLGNMIASKYPLANIKITDLGRWRSLVEADIVIGDGEPLSLFVSHWQNQDYMARQRQSELTSRRIREKGCRNFVLGADFNASIVSSSVSYLTRAIPMTGSFDAIGWPRPKYTCWGGTAIDHLFVSPSLQGRVVGSYVYHTLSSDHLPVILDMNIRV